MAVLLGEQLRRRRSSGDDGKGIYSWHEVAITNSSGYNAFHQFAASRLAAPRIAMLNFSRFFRFEIPRYSAT